MKYSYCIRVGLLLLLAFAFSASVYGYTIRGEIEDIFLVRPDTRYLDSQYYPPEYLELEDLVFYTCLEEDNLSLTSTVICRDDNSFQDIELQKWSDRNCYIGSYDMSQAECSDVVIRSTYELNDEPVTIEKEIKENRLTTLMDHVENAQYSDGGWRNSMDSAYGVWAMSYFPEIYKKEISMGIDWLKEYRDNDEKCWPRGTCNPRLTANILGILSFAGLNNSLRIMHDGAIWLERNQNYYTSTDIWTVNVTPYWFDVGCVLAYPDDINKTENISVGDSYFFNIVPEYKKSLDVICTDPVKVSIKTELGEEVVYYEGDNMSFDMPGAGWANGKRWSDTDVQTTLWALMTNISQERKNVAMSWLIDELHLEGTRGKYVGDEQNVTNAALYLYDVNRSPISSDFEGYDTINYSSTDVLQWLRFEQNNNGSWGSGNLSTQIKPTGDSVLSLLTIGFNRSNEVIEDAEQWVSENELETGWNTTMKNAYAFFVLKNNARPFLKSVPRVIVMDSPKQTLELYNPTTYDLNDLGFQFSENLTDILEIETQDGISGYSYIRLDITQKTPDVQNTYGYLYISNGGENISKIPVMVVSFPSINITPSSSIKVFGTRANLKFNIVKTSDTFSCKLSWDDEGITSQDKFTFMNQPDVGVDIKFTKSERLEKTYSGDFVCTTRDKSFLIPFSVSIDRYPSFPISVSPDRLFVNQTGEDVSFTVKNLLDETLDVSIAFQKNEDFFDIEKSKLVLNPAESRNVTIFNVIPPGFNVTSSNSIQVTALGQKESIRFLTDVVSSDGGGLNPIVFWSLIALIIIALGVGGYFAYVNRAKLMKLLKPGTQIEDVRNRIRTMEEKGTNLAIANYMRMLRFQGVKDQDIRKKLKEEGFSDSEINKSFKGEE